MVCNNFQNKFGLEEGVQKCSGMQPERRLRPEYINLYAFVTYKGLVNLRHDVYICKSSFGVNRNLINQEQQ